MQCNCCLSKKKLLRQVISLKKIPFDALDLEDGRIITIEKSKKIYIVSDKTILDESKNKVDDAFLFATTFSSLFSKNKIQSKIIGIDDALNRDLSDMAGLIIISPNRTSNHKNSSDTYNILNSDGINHTKLFLKKAFLLAKQSGKYLIKAASKFKQTKTEASHSDSFKSEFFKNSAIFATISFLGGTFGFADDNISDPMQGGFAGLVKTAALEWNGVLCRAIDFPSTDIQITNFDSTSKHYKKLSNFDAKAAIEAAVLLMLTSYSVNSYLHGVVEIGIKDQCCFIPELITSAIPILSVNSEPDKSCDKQQIDFNINHEDVVVITGGARGVTAECAVELASRFSPVIILIGRTPFPEQEAEWLRDVIAEADIKKAILANFLQDKSTNKGDVRKSLSPVELQKMSNKIAANREIIQNLKRISDAGSVVQYYSVDIRNFEDINRAVKDVREKFGKITAIVHGAGILEDKFIVDKTEAQFSAVFDTKVVGMENLLNATIHDNLKYVVFFSSVAARGGNVGQVDYAMANEVLNKTAQYYSKLHDKNRLNSLVNCKFLSINWGPWEGGMVSPSLKNAFTKRGIELIPLKQGAESFVDELCVSLFNTDKSKIETSNVEVVIGASLFGDIKSDSNIQHINITTKIPEDCREFDTNSSQPQHVLFSREQILEFAIGSPSKAFGERYREFDTEREIARLPGPPYFFMDRVIKADAKQWEVSSGGWIEAQFDMPFDGWYFRASDTDYLPFCILLEVALQPCGWLAAYCGSALKSSERLYFRNLGGEAQIFKPVKRVELSSTSMSEQKIVANGQQRLISINRDFITLTMRSKMTSVSQAGGMIIQNFLMEVMVGNKYIYKGKTNFGFFTAQAFANQTGIKNSPLMDYSLPENGDTLLDPECSGFDTKECYGMPTKPLLMVDTIEVMLPDGGKYGKGFIKGSKKVNPEEWFFKAHFYQDPVCPGSLGVESFLQIVKFYALKTWMYDPDKYDLVMNCHTHKWTYRGQIIPSCKNIEIYVHIKDIINDVSPIISSSNKLSDRFNKKNEIENQMEIDDYSNSKEKKSKIRADGLLYVDGLCIYQMEDFSMELVKR